MVGAAAKMGWSQDDFWFSTPSYFFAAFEGWIEQEIDRANTGFAQARMIAYYTSPRLREGTTMEDLWPLPWDKKEPQFEHIDPDEWERFEAAAERARIQRESK